MSGAVPGDKVYRYKGKRVKRHVWEQRIKQREACFLLHKKKAVAKSDEESQETPKTNEFVVDGDRIVTVSTLAKNLICSFCNQVLSLLCIEEEKLTGLSSTFIIRCHHCMRLNSVTSGSYTVPQNNDTRRKIYDVNSRAVIGSLNAGLGCTQLNEVLSTMNIPCVNNKLFKRHERLVGPSIEKVAKDSCLQAVMQEKAATLENLDKISKILPGNLPENFLIPNKSIPTTSLHLVNVSPSTSLPSTNVPSTHDFPLNFHSTNNNSMNSLPDNDYNKLENSSEEYVRLMASYDMGWSNRGTGRSYDSLSGFGAVVGSQTGLVLDYGTRNRKCRLCDLGRDKSEHDCRCNFSGSAKSMEADLAAELANNSLVLKAANVDIGILIGDEDSSTIAAVRKGTSKQVVKLSDINHIEKGVTKKLYELKSKHKELSAEGILWIQSCFSYAIKQNVGDTEKIANILQQIPRHAFNNHSTCSDWCKSVEDKENYDHTRVPGGFHSTALFRDLEALFAQLAENCEKFAHASSSQANESLNNSMASVAPKSKCYSTSESGDFRAAITVSRKNIGEFYIENVTQDLGLPAVSKHNKKYLQSLVRKSQCRKAKARTRQFKRRRNILKKSRSQLKNRKESSEGTSYESNMGLMTNDILRSEISPSLANNFDYLDSSNSTEEFALVYFDLETGSLASNAEILQIGVQYKEHSFGIYITPTKPISDAASKVHSLTYVAGELLFNGVRIPSVPLVQGLRTLLHFLSCIKKRCILVAHNAKFDSTRLIFSLQQTQLIDNFKNVVHGFCDTLPIFRKLLNRKNNCTLTFLAEEANIRIDGAHDAVQDVRMLQELKEYHKICDEDVISSTVMFDSILMHQINDRESKLVRETLVPLENVLSKIIINKLVSARIDFAKLRSVYTSTKQDGIYGLFTELANGKPRITKNKTIINKLVSFLENQGSD